MTVRTATVPLIHVENAEKIYLRFSVKYSFYCICFHETTAQRHYVESHLYLIAPKSVETLKVRTGMHQDPSAKHYKLTVLSQKLSLCSATFCTSFLYPVSPEIHGSVADTATDGRTDVRSK